MAVTGDASPTAPGGLARRLPPEVLAGLGAISRVSRALTGAGTLTELAYGALGEMRNGLGLDLAVLYLPEGSGRPVLRRFVTCAAETAPVTARDELSFDEEAWRLAVTSGTPLVFTAT